jgi:hypothetical protein
MDRRAWDQIVSGAGAVVAVVLLALGAAAIYGGNFGRDNVKDELRPQNITVAPADALTPEEAEVIGQYAGERVDTGPEAKAYADYINIHLNDPEGSMKGLTYSEWGAVQGELRAQIEATDSDDPALADLETELAAADSARDSVFKGTTLRGLLLGAYGWWTMSTLALFVGYGLVAGGILLGIFAFFGFRHARKVSLKVAEKPAKVAA